MLIYEVVQISQNVPFYRLSNCLFSTCSQFIDAIKRDIETLNKCIKHGKWDFNGAFKYIGWNSYVYLHNTHVAFSSIKYPETYDLWEPSTEVKVTTECSKHKSHHCLKPYFLDNRNLKHYLTYKLQGTTNDSEIALLKSYLVHLEKGSFPQADDAVFNWNENEWTERLVQSLKYVLPDRKVTFTANKGSQFSFLHFSSSGISALADSSIFQGAPDIIIKNKIVMNARSEPLDTSDSSGDENLIEACWQRNSLKGKCGSPDKLGELIAALHAALVCKILRKITKQKEIKEVDISVKGMLLDKIIGCIHCNLIGKISRPENAQCSIQIKITDVSGSQVSPEILCAEFEMLLGNFDGTII